ncbi:hypothetical protein BAC3_00373 [uncultured bacterium]|nr:hypothetical protein BAC3_00373 [uncultured bacterium]
MKIIGKNKLAQAFKVSRTTIENWCRSGCPSEFNGKEHTFTLSEVIKWHEAKFLKSNSDSESLAKSKATREHFKALLCELEYREKNNELVPAEAVKAVAFERARAVRDSLLNLPSRISDILSGEINAAGRIDKVKVSGILDKEIRVCLETLSENLKQPPEIKQ